MQKCSACQDLQKCSTVENVWQLCEELFLLKCIFFENHWHLCFFTAMLITYIKGETPAQFYLERGSAMTRATFVSFWMKLLSFIDWCYYYTQVSYTGSWESLVFYLIVWSGQTKDYTFGMCCFSARHAALRRKSKDCLARNRNNVSEWSNISTRRLLFQWASTINIQLSVLI